MSSNHPLRHIEPFDKLPEPLFRELSQVAQLHSYPANTEVFHQNDPPTGDLYVIREGLVSISVVSPGGLDIIVDYRHAGQFFGGTPIFTGEPYSGSARTVKASVCYLIPAALLQHLQKIHPQLWGDFTRLTLSRVRTLYSEIVVEQLGQNPALMEAYPFKKRLSEIMVTEMETCPPETTARQVARRMVERGVGSLLVVDEGRRLCGLITERELVVGAIAPEGSDPEALTAGEIMLPKPPTMRPDTYMYEAMTEMTRHQLKYLPILDREEVVGMVSLHDLMRYRSHKAMLLLGSIREERSLAGLAAIRRELVTVAQTLLAEMRSSPEMTEILSYIHHGIIRRTFELCLAEAAEQGQPPPAVRYCLLLLGSAGRREMLLAPDQDHALLFEDYPAEQHAEVEAFFTPLARRLVAALAEIGYPRCDGLVMADQRQWRGRLGDWRGRLRDWVANPEPQKVRNSSIFFDFAAVSGDPALAQDLRELVLEEVTGQSGFLYQMMALELRYKVPVGLLGRFVVERSGEHQGELSLKLGGILYIVDCVRTFALEKGVREVNTCARLKALVAADIFAAETAEHIRAAFEALTFLRLRHEIRQSGSGLAPGHHLDPHSLSKTEQDLLREAFQAVSKLQDATKRYFSRNPF